MARRSPGSPTLFVFLGIAALGTSACRAPAPRARTWTLEPRPVLSIGAVEGAAPYLFDDVTGVIRFTDGTLIVAVTGDHQIRAFDDSGRIRWGVGREGDGPGEFRGELRIARLPADSILVYDWFGRRLTYLNRSGVVGRTVSVPPSIPNVDLVGAFADGTAVIASRALHLAPGLNEDSVTYYRLGPNGELGVPIASSPGSRVFLMAGGGPPMVDDQPFGPTTATTMSDSLLVIVTGRAPDAVLVHPNGRRDTLRWTADPRPVDERLVAEWRERDLATTHDPKPSRRRWEDQVPIPRDLPYADRVVADRRGRLWIREWVAPDDSLAHWRVLDRSGGAVATAELPAGIDLYAVARDAVVGVTRDSLGVERVEEIRVRRGARSASGGQ